MPPKKKKAAAGGAKGGGGKGGGGKGGGGKAKKGGASQAEAAPAKKKKGCTKVKARHILCAKHSKIQEALARLNGTYENAEGTREAPMDFAAVARLMSEDKDLGWNTREGWSGDFAEVAFNTPVGTYSQPFRTGFGYHIVYVEGRK